MTKKDKKNNKISIWENELKDPESLLIYSQKLEKRLEYYETEKQLLEAEKLKLEKELYGLRNEIDKLREPPLLGGIVIGPMDNDPLSCKVLTSNGPIYVVKIHRKLRDRILESGMFVALNQRTLTIMEIIDINPDDYKTYSRNIHTGQKLLEQLAESQKTLIEYIKKIDNLENEFEILSKKMDVSGN